MSNISFKRDTLCRYSPSGGIDVLISRDTGIIPGYTTDRKPGRKLETTRNQAVYY